MTTMTAVRPVDVRARLEEARAAGFQALEESVAKDVLKALGVAVPAGLRIGHDEPLHACAPAFTSPYVLKALSSEALHKSDKGAVKLNLADLKEVEAARADMLTRLGDDAALTGFLLEEMREPGIEIVIGGTTDPQLGPMIMVGAGGIYAEVLQDTAFRLCPITEKDARDMLAELRMLPILQGARGRKGADIEQIVRTLLLLGGEDGFFTRHADVVGEFDLNPLVAYPDALVALDARMILNGQPAPAPQGDSRDPMDAFAPLFFPRTIAVAGASATGTTSGNRFIRLLKATGFQGDIYPIHPSADAIEGLKTYKKLSAAPGPVDYAFLTVPAGRVADVLGDVNGRLGFAQVMASGDGPDSHVWEQELRGMARDGGFRLIGPNCMGSHSPRGRFTFMEDVRMEQGSVGIVCQSGGLGMDILRRGENCGLRYSGLVTIGNSVDVQPADLLAFYLADPATRVIGMYVEDIKDGRRFRDLVRANKGGKPIVLLMGGLTSLGQKAAASHTGALAGNGRVWEAFCRQTGMILVRTLDEFLDALQACQLLVPKMQPGEATVTLFGNGGGTSVLATDCLDRAGFSLASTEGEAKEAFEAIKLPPGASVSNPIDLPANVLQQQNGKISSVILDIDRRLVRPYATIVHINVPVIMGYRHVENFIPNLIESVLDLPGDPQERPHRLVVVRSDGGEEADAWKRQLREAAFGKVPVFDEIPQAVGALSAIRSYEVFRSSVAG